MNISLNKNDHIEGEKNAPVTLIEYGDFECSHCGEAYPVVKELQKLEGDKIRFVFRNFPLSEIHPNALNAAYAAEASAKQGKFWEMHDLLFENQKSLDYHDLHSYAESLNLDIQQFINDMQSEKIIKKVKDDFMSGVEFGVNGTPTFFINGERFDEPAELELLQRAIDQATNT